MVDTSPGRAPRDPVGALVRVLGAVIECADRPVGVRELSRVLDTPPSSLQRTLLSARRASLLTSTRDGKWAVGWEMFRLASALTRQDPFVVVQGDLDDLAAELDETVVLTVLDRERNLRMFVARSDSSRPVRFVPDLYTWLPAMAGATGLAIVAHLDPAGRRRVHEATPAADRPARVGSYDEFEETCARIRADGMALSENEVDLGACSVAMPIATAAGPLCALGVIVPQQRFSPPTDPIVARIRRTAAAITAAFGGPPGLPAATGRAAADPR